MTGCCITLETGINPDHGNSKQAANKPVSKDLMELFSPLKSRFLKWPGLVWKKRFSEVEKPSIFLRNLFEICRVCNASTHHFFPKETLISLRNTNRVSFSVV
jgi:hypothetical protein